MNLSESFELRGKWWLPGNENHRVFGTLKFHPIGDFDLDLDGSLDPKRSPGKEIRLSPAVIHGVTKEGKECSLFKCSEKGASFYGTESQSSIFNVTFAVIGALILSFENTFFRSTTLQYTNLEAWVGRVGLWKTNYSKDNSSTSWSLAYKEQDRIKYSVRELQSTLCIEPSFSMRMGNFSRNLDHSESIRIRPKSKRNIEWFLSVAHHLRNLLSLFTVERFFYRSFKLEIGRMRIFGSKKLTKVEADLVFQQNHFGEVKTLGTHDVPFHHSIVRKDLKNIFSFWFKDQDLLEPVHDLFFEAMYNPHLGVEFQFISMIQALESLHRRLHRGRYISKKMYEGCRQALTSAIPLGIQKDLREALKNRIKYGNEYSLRKRLTLMGRSLNVKTRKLVDHDYSTLVSRSVDTRNYLTHYDPLLKPKAMSKLEMFEATFSLRLLLTIYLFKQIGMREHVVTDIVRSHMKFTKPKLSP